MLGLKLKYNPITGEELTGNEKLKTMCVNCQFYDTVENVCRNEENMASAIKKLEESVSGYKITNIELAPLPLKSVVKKCGNWKFSIDRITEFINSINLVEKESTAD